MKKRVLAIFISVLMCFSLVPMSAFAGGSTTYINENGEATDAPQGCFYFNNDEITSLTGGWCVSNTNRTIENPVELESDVSLILCDGITLTITGGIIGNDHTLTVYGQTNQTGKLIVSNSADQKAAIDCNLVIYGGNVTATGGNTNGGQDEKAGNGINGNVTMNRGILTANGGATVQGGIGGSAIKGDVTVNGGTVNANGGNSVKMGLAVEGQLTFKEGKFIGKRGEWNNSGLASLDQGVLSQAPIAPNRYNELKAITTDSWLPNGLIVKVIKDSMDPEKRLIDWDGTYPLNGIQGINYVSFETYESPFMLTIDNLPSKVLNTIYTDITLTGTYNCNKNYKKLKLEVETEGPEGSNPTVTVYNSDYNKSLGNNADWCNEFETGTASNYERQSSLKIELDKEGEYTLTFNLIDLEDNNNVIATKCVILETDTNTHTHDDVTFDTMWAKAEEFPSEAGDYVLATDLYLWDYGNGYQFNKHAPAGVTNLCLNGHIIGLDTYCSIYVDENAVLNIYDCNPNEEHKGFLYTLSENAGIWRESPIDYYPEDMYKPKSLYGGLIVGESDTAVYIDNGELNLYGGTITGSEGGYFGEGGGVSVNNGGKFVMNDGCITNNAVDCGVSLGAGVYVDPYSTFIMHGGKICDNVAMGSGSVPGLGGGVGVEKGGTFIADGGSITGNSAFGAGSGVYIANGTQNSNDDDPLLTCLAAGTPITLADGSRTAIENLKIGDEVRVFDHETGEISTSKLFDLWKFPQPKDNAFTLHFTNDIDVTAVGGHCFFEKEANEYVVVNTENVNSYIGHDFYNADSACWETLTSVDFLDEAVDTYIIVSEKNFNTFANGMLSNVDGLYATLCNIFDFDENLKIDAEKKAADIEEYGLWNYDSEHFQYVTEDTYNALNLQYLGVAIGKGILTPEELAKSAQDTVKYNTDLVRPEMLNQSDSGNKPAPTRSNLSASSMFSPVKSMKLLGAPEPTPDPEPVEPGVYLGGSIKITGNKNSYLNTEENVFLCDKAEAPKITIGDGTVALAPTNEMSVGITIGNAKKIENESELPPKRTTGTFTTNGTYDNIKNFFSDSSDFLATYVADHLELKVAEIAQIVQTGTIYKNVTAALDAAQSGETVKLLENFTENKYIEVKPNVTFNLNGFELTTDKAVIVFGTLVDTNTEHSGKLNLVNTKMLVYNTDKITISKGLDTYQNVNVLPVWNETAKSYSLYSVTSFGTEWETTVDKPQYNFSMTSGDFEAIFANNSNVEVHVCLYYTNSEGDDVSCDYLIGSSIVEEYIQDAENSHIYVAFTGTDNLTNMKACTYLKAKDCSFSIGSITRNYDIN